MSKFSVEFYETDNGKKPAKEFILSQKNKMQVKIFELISLLQSYGNQLRLPYSKHLDDGIFEIRAKSNKDITRILYFFYHKGRIIMTNGFTKKTQKTPSSEIALAKKYRAEFLERESNK